MPPPLATIRVLHLASSSDIGGTERMVLALVRARSSRFEMAVASLDGSGRLTEACAEAGARAWNWRIGAGPRGIVRLARGMAQIRRERWDVIQTYGSRADLPARLFRRWLRPAALVGSVRSAEPRRSWLKVWLDRAMAEAADWTIANSDTGRELAVRRKAARPDRIETIHNGVELDPPGLAPRADARMAIGLDEAAFPVVAHIANVRPMKGHADALRAAAVVARHWPKTVFLFAGRDDSGGAYARLAGELGVGAMARWLGYHPRPREILRAADLAILPSHYEGCPAALLEAMAERRPIAASRAGGIPELVRHEREALLVEPRRPEALAEAIGRLARDRALRERLAAAARARAEAEFSLERMVRRYEERYAWLAREAGRPR